MKHDRICIVLTQELRRKLRVSAAQMDMNLSELVRLAIEYYIVKVLEK